MHRNRLVGHLAVRYFVVCLAALLVLGWLAARTFDRSLTRSTWTELEAAANLVAGEVADNLAAANADDRSLAVAAADRIGNATRTRITLIAPSGAVLHDNRDDAERMENHADLPEVIAARAGKQGRDTRYSNSRNVQMMYVAVPLVRESDGQLVGIARAATSSEEIERVFHESQRSLLLGIVGVATVAGLVGWWLARRTAEPVEQLCAGANQLAHGEQAGKLPPAEIEEFASLATSLNQISHLLEERTLRIGRQGHEQEAVLASMVEGVLAVDSEERVITLNSAAAELVGSRQADLYGKNLQEVIRNADLRRFVKNALDSAEPMEHDVVLHGEGERILRVRGTALRDGRGRSVGAVIVLNDITRFRHLENLRRDFVANVSHELKTPIASIKGFVETLLDGALHQAEDAERFLRIIAKQADRLNSIIEDLLSLSKIEQSEEAANLPLAEAPLRPVLEAVLHDCETQAADRNITVTLNCEDDLLAQINSPLLEQAVINLVDNALKYSEAGREVLLEAARGEGEIVISVRDHGCGIEKEHLPRLFERFYRVDRARSRKLGGTGLGLAIVKHIVQAHGGEISVASTPGTGSVFSIHLPVKAGVPVGQV